MEGVVLEILQKAGLADFREGFEKFGVASIEDLGELGYVDLEELGLNRVQQRRLERTLDEHKNKGGSTPKRRRLGPDEFASAMKNDSDAHDRRPPGDLQAASVAVSLHAGEPSVLPAPNAINVEKVSSPGDGDNTSGLGSAAPANPFDGLSTSLSASTLPLRESNSEDVPDLAPHMDEFMHHLSTLGEPCGHGMFGHVPNMMEAAPSQQTDVVLLIGLQNDLQDDMHVAKLVTSTEGVLSLCNTLLPKSGRSLPRPKINFADLATVPDLQVQGLLGERDAIRGFLESRGVPTNATEQLQECGLYAVHQANRLRLIFWPTEKGWQDPSQRRSVINFVHFIFQLTEDVSWLVSQHDLDVVGGRGEATTLGKTGRNMDLQISMKATSEDDCTLGDGFVVPILVPGVDKSLYEGAHLFNNRHGAVLTVTWMQEAGMHVDEKRNDPHTITNFFRLVGQSHRVVFHDNFKLEQCEMFLSVVAGPQVDELNRQEQDRRRHLDFQRNDTLQAIAENELAKLQDFQTKLASAVDAELLTRFPREFCALRGLEDCSICMGALDATAVHLPCNKAHVFHRACAELALAGTPGCPLCQVEFQRDGACSDLVNLDAGADLAKQFPCSTLAGMWQYGEKDVFAIMDQKNELIWTCENLLLEGSIRHGTGTGEGYMYADLTKYTRNGSVHRKKWGAARLKVVNENTITMNIREEGCKAWGVMHTAGRQQISPSSEISFEASVVKTLHRMVNNIKTSYAFAMVANSQRWLVGEHSNFASTARQMILDAIQKPSTYFKDWYDVLVPNQSRLKSFTIAQKKDFSTDQVKEEIAKMMRSGITDNQEYLKMITSCKEDIYKCLSSWLDQLALGMVKVAHGPTFAGKRQEVDGDHLKQKHGLDAERRVKFCEILHLIQALALPDAPRVFLARMVYRNGPQSGDTSTYNFDYSIEVTGAPQVSAGMLQLQVERASFEHALSSGAVVQPGLNKIQRTIRLESECELLSSGVLANDRRLDIFCDVHKHVKVAITRVGEPHKVVLHVKRAIDVTCFNDTLRMIATYSAESGTVAIYAWDDQFVRHHEYCAPLTLASYQQDSELLRMHFLPASKQLCFIMVGGAVRIYELTSNTMRPRGFHIGIHALTLTDSRGSAILVLRDPALNSCQQAGNTGADGSTPASAPMDIDQGALLEMDVYIVADGRRIKTLQIPTPITKLQQSSVSVVQLYGVDFLLAADLENGNLHGWQLKLQTAEQVCSLEQLHGACESWKAKSSGEDKCTLDILYQVFGKYTSKPALAVAEHVGSDAITLVRRLTVLGPHVEAEFADDGTTQEQSSAFQRYTDQLLNRLRKDTQKPELDDLRLEVSFMPSQTHPSLGMSWQKPEGDIVKTNVEQLVRKLICLVPVQIARAENETFTILKDGMREETGGFNQLRELADFISFGLYETILEQNENRVVVISSMGKQSTGKSYMLNHLSGSCFDTSGGRCTDGVWMTVREFQQVTYVLLDFEGLGSFERSAQEDMLLSVFNAAISHVSLFRTEMRLDCDTANIFGRMQQGAKLIEGDPELFNGMFQIVVKDVVQDANEVTMEFSRKIQHIVSRDKEDNFFLRLYNGRIGILPFPALGRSEFYKEFGSLVSKVQEAKHFESGRQFMRNTKLLMAKISMKDWTPTDQNKIRILLSSLRESLWTAVVAGCMAMTEDGPTPLLHLRTNKTFTLTQESKHADEEAPAEGSQPHAEFVETVLASLPDEGLLLAAATGEDALDICMSPETLEELAKKVRPALEELSMKVILARDGKAAELELRSHLSAALKSLVDRRTQRILAWLQANLEHIGDEGDSQRLLMEAKTMLALLSKRLRLCDQSCCSCRLACWLPAEHASDVGHSCRTNHECHDLCGFCESKATKCSLVGGHDGNHDCGDASHSCGQLCSLSSLKNCGQRCTLKPGHDTKEPHMCSALKHLCGKPCELPGCPHTCIHPHDIMHDTCECHLLACPNRCSFANCSFMCAAPDHFHAPDGDGSQCMCEQPHSCPHECESQGICEIYSELVVKKEKFSGRHDTFDYDAIETEQNGIRKNCCKVVPPGEKEHSGVHIHSSTTNLVHYCDVKCPTCGYYCTLPWAHSGEHSTRHGNMRRMYFVSDQDVFTVGSRKYAPSESGKAEMCNMYCHRAGRGHVHVKLCADFARRPDSCCTISTLPGRRHSDRKYFPTPDEPKDEFTHGAFWESIGFQDPCTSDDKELFAKCAHFCSDASHTEEGDLLAQASFCTLPLWHGSLNGQAATDHIAQHGGLVSRDGHHFECTHVQGQPVHTIFVIDRSTSMSQGDARPQTMPWRTTHPNRLGCALAAVQSFVEKRRSSSPGDVVSFLAFNGSLKAGPSNVPITDFHSHVGWLQGLTPSGGTDFNVALAGVAPCLTLASAADFRCMVIFLSDGHAPHPEQSLRTLYAAAERHAPGKPVRLHTVQFPPVDDNARGVLRAIAASAKALAGQDDFANASSFIESIDGIALQEAFVGIADSLASAAGGLLTA